jgi:DNA polymerase I
MIICYVDSDRSINLRWRDKDGNREEKKIEDFEPYFYINDLEEEYTGYTVTQNVIGRRVKLSYPFRYEEGDWIDLNNNKLKKVYVQKPGDVPTARKMWPKTYEADVPFHYRYCVDELKEVPEYKLRKWYWDMEWLNDDPEHGDAITCISVWDSDIGASNNEYNTIFFWTPDGDKMFDNEKDMLETFVQYMETRDPDMLISWFGAKFDLPKLIHRLVENDIDPRRLSPLGDVKGYTYGYLSKAVDNYSQIEQPIRGRICLDLNLAFERQWNDAQRGTLPSMALDDIAERVLGEKKLVSEKFPDKNEFFRRGWLEDTNTYLEYAMKDVSLIKCIDEKMALSDGVLSLQRLLVAPFDACFFATNMASIYFMRHAWWKAPTGDKSVIKQQYPGAMIYDPGKNKTNGLYSGVAAFDFASLYPSMMLARNISWETKSPRPTEFAVNLSTPRDFSEIEEKNMVYYKTDKLGVLPQAVLELKTLRDDYKVRMKKAKDDEEYTKWYNNQMAVKRLMASFYGIIGYHGYGWSDITVASSITASAREAIRAVANKVEEL